MIDVYVTTYNRAEMLKRTIKSILNQTYTDFKLTILDNCSTDNTKEIVASFTDPRIFYHRQEKNLGPLGNMNFGITASKNKYFVVFHDDDIMAPSMLEKEIDALEQNPDICAVSCRTKAIQMDDNLPKFEKSENSILKLIKYNNKFFAKSFINDRNVMMFPTIMYRTDFLRKHEIYLKPEAGPSCDVLICMDIEKAGGTLGIIEEQLAYYRGHEEQFSQRARVDMVKCLYLYMSKDKYYREILDENKKGQNRTYKKLLFNEMCLYAGEKISSNEWKSDMNSYKEVLNLSTVTKLYGIFVMNICITISPVIKKLYAMIKNRRGKD